MEGVRKFIDLAFIIDLENYGHALTKWFKFRQMFHTVDQSMTNKAYNEYLPIVKPVIYRFSQITSKLPADQFGFYTSLNNLQIAKMKELFEPLQKFQIIAQTPQKNYILANEDAEKYVQKSQETIHKLDLSTLPTNAELQWWYHTLATKNIIVTSKVVRGKGLGAIQLGMPTANLAVTQQIQKQLLQFPNGIYITKFAFVKKQVNHGEYVAVASLGTNPHYENFTKKRCVEAYVFNDFGQQKFYEQEVSVQFLRLIRLEGKFPSFDSFLHAMHNDIQIGKMFSK